ncbi:VWA domain-containing protein [Margalitia sp. FSL K6-0131]|uniref:VWA domain-containing protein n=1 Tax=Margalitia sp. FSL K6-0131 TaxID=2954604 RepID=UPI004046A0C4
MKGLKVRTFLILVIIAVVLIGCENTKSKVEDQDSHENTTTETNASKEVSSSNPENEEHSKIGVPPLPSTYQELSNLPAGELAGFKHELDNDEELLNQLKDLPNISSKPTHDELDLFYTKLLEKVQQGFQGPEEAINQLKFQSIGDPNIKDPRYQFKDNLNVEILLDASGSMAEIIDGKSKMDIAKESILSFVSELPKQARVGLRVYGHKGSGADSDKSLSCGSSEIVYSMSNYSDQPFKQALNKFSPKGWTPTGLALNEAKKDLEKFNGENNTNIVYLVSDGISTCNDDPIGAAKDLYDSNVSPIINVIGFDVDSKGQNELKQIANATKGIYETVKNQGELQKQLDNIKNVAEQWKEWKAHGEQELRIKKVKNELSIFGYVTEEERKEVDEKTDISFLLSKFYQNKLMDNEAFDYLNNKNNEYHQWIKTEIDQFNQELKALNEKSYGEALKVLEDKYNVNTQ